MRFAFTVNIQFEAKDNQEAYEVIKEYINGRESEYEGWDGKAVGSYLEWTGSQIPHDLSGIMKIEVSERLIK